MKIAHVLLDASAEEGRLAADLCRRMEEEGHLSLLCYAIGHPIGKLSSYRIGNLPGARKRNWIIKRVDHALIALDREAHLFRSRLTDRSGFYSSFVTKRLICQLKAFHPDLVHLQRLHGYALNVPLLFDYLYHAEIPVVWTMRDCWAWTGHCIWYTNVPGKDGGCGHWKTGCGACPRKRQYPQSLFRDASAQNWREKRMIFTRLPYLVLTAPGRWLTEQCGESFFSKTPAYTIPDSFDTEQFRLPRDDEQLQIILRYYRIDRRSEKPLILTMAEVWDEHAGLSDLEDVAARLGNDVRIAVIGLDQLQRQSPLPDNMQALASPQSMRDLAVLLYAADLFLYTSHGEASPLPLLKAMACGTRALCFDAGALQEAAYPGVCETVPLGDTEAMAQEALRMLELPRNDEECRETALRMLPSHRMEAYQRLYENLYRHSPAYLKMQESGEPQATETGA